MERLKLLKYKDFKISGKSLGSVYTFENIGDELPLHTHTEETNHYTIVASGSIECLGSSKGKILKSPEAIAWKVGTPHGFKALEPNTVVYNINTWQN